MVLKAKNLTDSETSESVIGTPYYISPEIYQNKKYDKKTDVWSIGCILFELVTLRRAFDAKSLFFKKLFLKDYQQKFLKV